METLNKLIIEWGSASLPLAGEVVSGDKHVVKVLPHGALLAAMDGLGHGEEAAAAANRVARVLQAADNESLISLLKRCHERLRSTRGDRKSTRLNSSHLVISYAVFCLKKK